MYISWKQSNRTINIGSGEHIFCLKCKFKWLKSRAINWLTTFYSINVDDLEISTESGGPAIEYIEFFAEGLEVIAYFEPKEDLEDSAKGDNPNVLVLFTVNYDQPFDDYKTYASKIAKQYSAPSKTLAVSRGTCYGWCEKVGSKGIFSDETYPMFTISRSMVFLGVN